MTLEELYEIKTDGPSESARSEAQRRLDAIAKPIDGLGSLEELICRIAAIRGTPDFSIGKKALVIMCADNGVVCEGVTQAGSEVTARVAHLMGQRLSSVGIMSASYPLDIRTVDTGIDSDEDIPGLIGRRIRRGTGNIAETCAMSAEECLRAIDCGIETVADLSAGGCDLIATGEMGIGNTTTATAVLCALCDLDPKEVTGRGAGLDDEGLERKIMVIDRALRLHGMDRGIDLCDLSPDVYTKEHAFRVLHTLGGLDIAGLAGVFIGGALYHIPVIIDGLISAVAALCAKLMVPGCGFSMTASHTGREKGCAFVLEKLGLRAVIDADLALGEGSGAVLLMPVLDMVYSLYANGTRFGGDTGIDEYERFDRR